jgi:Zn finger protein HypA/HybF involved in hydrogenase expression
MEVLDFNRTLEQELLALSRGVSLECLVCGEFVLRRGSALHCPECGSTLGEEAEIAAIQLEFDLQAG